MDSDTTFSLVSLADDNDMIPSSPSRCPSATVSNTAEASCLLRSTPTMLEHFAPLTPRTKAVVASLAFPVAHMEDDSDATASCISSAPSSPCPSSSSRPSSPSAQRTRSTRRRGSESSDSEPDGPPVYFGTPSSAEHARRRKVSAKMRERRLLRRDSLDLARRRSVGPIMPSSDEPQSSDTINSSTTDNGKDEEEDVQLSSEADDAPAAQEVQSNTLDLEDENTLGADQDKAQDSTMVLLPDADVELSVSEREEMQAEEASNEAVAEVQPRESMDDADQALEAVHDHDDQEPEPGDSANEQAVAVKQEHEQPEELEELQSDQEEEHREPSAIVHVEETAEEETIEPLEAAESSQAVSPTMEELIATIEVPVVGEQRSVECEVQIQTPSSPVDAPASPSQPPPPASPHTPSRPGQILVAQSCAISAHEGHSFEALSPGVALAAHSSATRGDASLLIDALRHESYNDSLQQPDSPFAMHHHGMMLEMEQPLYGKSPIRELGGGGGGGSPLKRRRSARISMRNEELLAQQEQKAQQEQSSPTKPWFSPSKTGTASPATVADALSAWAGSAITSPQKRALHELPPHSLPDWATGDASPRKPMRALQRARALAAASPVKTSPVKANVVLPLVDAASERARAANADVLLRLAAATPLPPPSPEKPGPPELVPAASLSVAPPLPSTQASADGPSARLFETFKASRLAATQASDAAAQPARPASAASSVPEAQGDNRTARAPGSALKAPSTTSRLAGTSSTRPGVTAAPRPGAPAVKHTVKTASILKAPAAVSRLPKPAPTSGIARPTTASSLRKPATAAARPPVAASAAVRAVAPALRATPTVAAAQVRKGGDPVRPVPERKSAAVRSAGAARAPASAAPMAAATVRPAMAPRIRSAAAASRAPPKSAPAAPRQASSSPTRAPLAARLRTAAPIAPSPVQSASRTPASGAAPVRVPFVRSAARSVNSVPASRVCNSPTRQERSPPLPLLPGSPEKKSAVFAAASAPALAPAVTVPPVPQVPSVYGSQAPPGRARRVPAASEAAIKTPPATTVSPVSVPVPSTASLAPCVMPTAANTSVAASRPTFLTAVPLESERAPGRAMRGPFTNTQPTAVPSAVVLQPDLLVSPMKAARRAGASDEAAPSSDSAQSIEGATLLAGKALRPRVAARTAQTITSQRVFSNSESKPEVEEPASTSSTTAPGSRRPARAAAARTPAPASVLKVSSKENATDLPLSHAELVRLTNQHTRRNEAYLAKLDVVTIRIEGPRPPSPTSKVRTVAGARMNKDEAALARERRARGRGSLELQLDDDSDGELPPMEAMGVEKHTLGAGEEELFATPPRVAAAGGRKRVKWHKALFVGPSEASAEHMAESENGIPAKAVRLRYGAPRSSLAAKEIILDRNGNIPIEAPLSPRMRRTKVTIRKYVYDDDC